MSYSKSPPDGKSPSDGKLAPRGTPTSDGKLAPRGNREVDKVTEAVLEKYRTVKRVKGLNYYTSREETYIKEVVNKTKLHADCT